MFVFLVVVRNILYLDNNVKGTHCYGSTQILTGFILFTATSMSTK